MKDFREKGNCLIRSTMLPFFTAILFIFSIFLFGNNITEANANITYKITNISLQTGKCTIYGYFYNNGDRGATVTTVRFFGSIRDSNEYVMYTINQTFSGSTCTVGFLSAGDRRSWSFTIKQDIFSAYNGTFYWNINSNTTWNS